MTIKFNPYLRAAWRAETKGTEMTVENPRTIQNIEIQTASGPLDSFEDRLADELMAVFGTGAELIDDVVASLNAAGSRDREGAPWNEASFRDQMATSGAALFAVEEEEGL